MAETLLAPASSGQDHAIDAIATARAHRQARVSRPAASRGACSCSSDRRVSARPKPRWRSPTCCSAANARSITINMSEFQEKHTRLAADRLAAGLCRLRRGRRADRSGAPAALFGGAARRSRKGAPRCAETVLTRCSTRARWTDGEGREIDFRNTLIFLTSNLATDVITEMTNGDEKPDAATLLAAVRPILSRHFKPALLARMR